MSGSKRDLHEDRDAIHVLPLSIIPLQTKTLQQARLVKNAKLQGTLELFSEGEAGSGQLLPDELVEFFDFPGERAADLEIVTALAALPSYDVYSLRLELRDLGINVQDYDQLKLSPNKAEELTEYMNTFTRPLIARIYGDTGESERSLDELISSSTRTRRRHARTSPTWRMLWTSVWPRSPCFSSAMRMSRASFPYSELLRGFPKG